MAPAAVTRTALEVKAAAPEEEPLPAEAEGEAEG